MKLKTKISETLLEGFLKLQTVSFAMKPDDDVIDVARDDDVTLPTPASPPLRPQFNNAMQVELASNGDTVAPCRMPV